MKHFGLAMMMVVTSLSLFALPEAPAEAQVAAMPPAGQTTPLADSSVGQRRANPPIRLPMWFEANRGQADERVKFISRGNGFSLFLTSTEAVLAFYSWPGEPSVAEPAGGKAAVAFLRMKLLGSNPSPLVVGLNELPGKTNYLIGKDTGKWRAGVPTYAKVFYEEVYRGIGMVYYLSGQELEYDFVVAPGASPDAIRLRWEGASRVRVDAGGNLLVETPYGELRHNRPRIYQRDSEGGQQEIAGGFTLAGSNEVRFEVGAYDASKPLYIDPVLSYSTYLGGSGYDTGRAIAVDASGNIYVAGGTVSSDFPLAAPAQSQMGSASFMDAFVAKLSADGASLIYATYLGGTYGDIAYGMAVDAAGRAHVTGVTGSANFPTVGAFQAASGGVEDAFVATLSPAGSSLAFSSYLGGSNTDIASALALDSAGAALVVGHTLSPYFPTSPGVVQPACSNVFCSDAFVARVTDSGTLSFSSFLGGANSETASGVALDAGGNIYVAGSTNSPNFPVTPGAFQVTCARCDLFYYDVFITKLNPVASSLVYSTYLGGFRDDYGNGIAVDAVGNAYVTGEAESSDFDVTAGVFQPAGMFDAFVTKVDPTGSALVYSTYLGGSVRDQGRGIAVDAAGNAYVTGSTHSADFPIALPTQSLHGGIGASDAFVSIVNPTGSALVFSTFLGGLGSDSGMRIVVDSQGNSYVAGETFAANFPATEAARQNTNAGSSDAFITRFAAEPPPNKKVLWNRKLRPLYSYSQVHPLSSADSSHLALAEPGGSGSASSPVPEDAGTALGPGGDAVARAVWEHALDAIAGPGAAGSTPHAPRILVEARASNNQGVVLIAGTQLLAGAEGVLPHSRPVIRGAESISIYCTGLGPVTNPPPSGTVAESEPPSHTLARPTVTIGGVPAMVSFSGLAPGWAGLYEVTVLVPAGAPAGNAIPVVLAVGGVESNVVLIAIQP